MTLSIPNNPVVFRYDVDESIKIGKARFLKDEEIQVICFNNMGSLLEMLPVTKDIVEKIGGDLIDIFVGARCIWKSNVNRKRFEKIEKKKRLEESKKNGFSSKIELENYLKSLRRQN